MSAISDLMDAKASPENDVSFARAVGSALGAGLWVMHIANGLAVSRATVLRWARGEAAPHVAMRGPVFEVLEAGLGELDARKAVLREVCQAMAFALDWDVYDDALSWDCITDGTAAVRLAARGQGACGSPRMGDVFAFGERTATVTAAHFAGKWWTIIVEVSP